MTELEDTTYDYQYESNDPYVYPGTRVLINKFGFVNQEQLSKTERLLSFSRELQLRTQRLPGNYDLAHLQAFHKFLFDEIYDWAGQIRQQGFLSKNRTIFCGAQFIIPYSNGFFRQLKNENYLRGMNKSDFIEHVTFYMGEINALHPFREGNGRTQRAFIAQLGRDAGWELNLHLADKNELCEAYIATELRDYTPLTTILNDTMVPYRKQSIQKDTSNVEIAEINRAQTKRRSR